MLKFWNAVYNILLVPAIWVFFAIYGLFNSKVKSGFKGRRDLFNNLNKSLSVLSPGNKSILIHCSSLGEYQQAMPLISELSRLNYNIVVSFFSPSGFNNSKITSSGCIKTYLPFDSKKNVKKFLDILNPEFVIFMRYDLWFNFVYECHNREIPMYIANARFDKADWSWNYPVARSFKIEMYSMLNIIFTIDTKDETEYKKIFNEKDVSVYLIGDSKFERVKQAGKRSYDIPGFENLHIEDKKVFVIGSSWKEDENIILPVVNKLLSYEAGLLTVLVPHEPKEKKIAIIEKNLRNEFPAIRPLRYSLIDNYKNENFIIVDQIGLLLRLYSLAYFSYVGGGLKSGLHNILEPAIYNMPIFFGNQVKNSDEDDILIKAGCGFAINNKRQLYKLMKTFLINRELRNEIGENCEKVFIGSEGIARKIVNKITNTNV